MWVGRESWRHGRRRWRARNQSRRMWQISTQLSSCRSRHICWMEEEYRRRDSSKYSVPNPTISNVSRNARLLSQPRKHWRFSKVLATKTVKSWGSVQSSHVQIGWSVKFCLSHRCLCVQQSSRLVRPEIRTIWLTNSQTSLRPTINWRRKLGLLISRHQWVFSFQKRVWWRRFSHNRRGCQTSAIPCCDIDRQLHSGSPNGETCFGSFDADAFRPHRREAVHWSQSNSAWRARRVEFEATWWASVSISQLERSSHLIPTCRLTRLEFRGLLPKIWPFRRSSPHSISTSCKNLWTEVIASIQGPSILSVTMELVLTCATIHALPICIYSLAIESKDTWEMAISLFSTDSRLFTRCRWWGIVSRSCRGRRSVWIFQSVSIPKLLSTINLSISASPYNADFDGDEMNLHVSCCRRTYLFNLFSCRNRSRPKLKSWRSQWCRVSWSLPRQTSRLWELSKTPWLRFEWWRSEISSLSCHVLWTSACTILTGTARFLFLQSWSRNLCGLASRCSPWSFLVRSFIFEFIALERVHIVFSTTLVRRCWCPANVQDKLLGWIRAINWNCRVLIVVSCRTIR